MRRILLIMLALVGFTSGEAEAQSDWRLTLDVGATAFSAAAHDTSADPVQLRPWHPRIYSLRVTRDAGRLGVGMTLGISEGALGVNVQDFAVLDGTNAPLIELAPELRYRLVAIGSGGTLHLSIGPVIDLWMPQDADARTVCGGIGAATLSLPLAGSWLVDVRGDLAVTGSLLTPEEESPELIRESTMRRGRIALGITKKL